MFVQISTDISTQVRDEITRYKRHSSNNVSFDNYLYYAIKAWCNHLSIPQDINDYILQKYQLDEVKELTNYIWQEGIAEKKRFKVPSPFGEFTTWLTVENQLYKYLSILFNRINIRNGNLNFVVIIAFIITAVGYWIYIINRQHNPKPTVQPPPVQRITKQFLVLVVSALQADLLESLEAKKCINFNDGESLYEITKYLWLGSETELLQRTANINQYKVSKGQESEYDIYLVYIELNQPDKGFKANMNQLDRYDAFRKLADLFVDLKVSPRLQMEAYENIEVYSR